MKSKQLIMKMGLLLTVISLGFASVIANEVDRNELSPAAVYIQETENFSEAFSMMNLFSVPDSQSLNLGFESELTGWTTSGNVTVGEYANIAANTNNWEVWPKNSKMAILEPSGASTPLSTIASVLHISSDSQAYFLANFPKPTNFAYIYKDISLTAGQIYYVAWNYVATDYAPFNDASFFTLSNINNPSANPTINGITTDVSLLGATVLGTGNYSTGSYGSTGWQTLSFKANETSSYRIGFMVFNLDDTALSPLLFVDDGPGVVKLNGTIFEPIGEDPNAPPPPVPDTTSPTLSAVSVSRTSDTSATVKFTTDENGFYYYVVVEDGASVPTMNTDGTGTSCTTGEVTITNPAGLSAGAKDIYIKVKDGSENVSEILKMDIDAFQPPKSSQTITFNALPTKTYGDTDFTLSATASSGLPVTFTSSNSSIASINNTTVTIHKQGVVTITASQAGNNSYYEANAQQTLTIQKRSLQVINTAVAVKVYDGTATATLSGSELQGVVSDDEVQLSQATTGTFLSASAGEQKTVTTQFALTGTDSENYTLEQPTNLQGEITKRSVTITADSKTKIYGNNEPTLTYQITEGSLVFGDGFTGTLTRVSGDTVGNYDITQGSVSLNDNYTLSYVKGNLEVTKRPITITADAKTKIYGNDDPVLTYQITEGSLAFQDAFNGTLTRVAGDKVGNYDITQGSVALSDNYTLSYVKGNLEITQRPITITAEAKTKVYGNDDPALTYQITDGSLAFQDAFSGTLTRAAGDTVGNYDITQGSVALSDNYTLSYVKGNLEVTKRPVTITAEAKTKVYGEDDPALTYQITEGSLAFQDAFSGVLTRATGETVGNYNITQGSVALSDNYTLSFVKGNLEITKRPITITADAKTKVYGNDDPALTYQITEGSLAFQDAFSGVLTRATGETVGNYNITQGSVALSDNYYLSYVKGNLEITKRYVTITADYKFKIYGTADPRLTFQITSGSLAFEDKVTGALTRISGDLVDHYEIMQGTIGLNSNYVLTYIKGDFEIIQRQVTITADSKTKVYGEEDPVLTYHITSGKLVFEEEFSGILTRQLGENVDNYDITLGSVSLNENYKLVFIKGNLEITQRPITITAEAKTKVYGNNEPTLTYQITEGSLVFGDGFTGTLTRVAGDMVGNYDINQGSVALNDNYTLSYVKGNLEITQRPITITAEAKTKIYGDNDPVLTYQITEGNLVYQDAFTGTLTRVAGDTVGNYDITQGSVALSDNYTLSYVKGNLEITQRPITITAEAKTKVYGEDDPALTFQITEGSLAFQDAFTGTLTRVAGDTVGNYDITQGSVALSDNYTLSYVKGNLEITQRPITITAEAKTKVYGENDPALTYQITEGSLAFQDAFAGSLTRATGETVGNYDITQGSVALNSNYNLSFVKSNLEITKRPVTITAEAKTKVYGENDPALTYQITEGNLVYQDAFTGTLTRVAGDMVGNYDITQGSVALNSNYNLSFVKGNLEITKRPITITADDKTKVYGNEDPELTYQVTTMTPLYLVTSGNLVFQDTFTGSLTREAGETVGNYDITQGSVALNNNYNLSFVKGNLEITQRPVTITAEAKTKVYGNEDPELTYQVTTVTPMVLVTSGNLVFQDTFTGSLTREVGENVGTYDITQGTVVLSDNYALSYVKGTLEITQRPITVTADSQGKVYGTADPALTYRITEGALAYDDTFTGVLDRDYGEDIGNYLIRQGSLSLNDNYTLTYHLSSLEISPRSITITMDEIEKIENDPDPEFTYQLTSGQLIGSDYLDGTLSRDPGELPGSYRINEGTLSAGPNYEITFITATLSIQPMPALQNKDNVEVIINGNVEQIGKQTVVEDDLGEETLLLTVDSEQALKRIEELQQQPNENESPGKNTFIVPITEGTSTNVKVNLTGDVIKNLEEGEFDVQIQSGNITYNIPAQEFTIMNVANQMNVPEDQLRSIEIETSISPVSEEATTAFRNFVEDNNDVLVFPPVSFHIEAKTYKQDGSVESVPITRFNNYVKRTIELPENTDPKLVTTGIIFHADGSYSHVPTTVYQLDGKWFATINSLTNSEYALIYRSITVPSVMNHWSKATVEEMASRLVLTNPESFEPDLNVTRAEFADYVVRALGLFRKESIALSTFSDIGNDHEFYLVIEIAHRYGIINGYLDGTFQPNQQITREEAMAMYSRAMKITKLPEEEPERCNEFEDFTQVSQWAVSYVKNVVAAKVFNGTSSTTLSPNSFLTHAESLTAIRNLLAKSSLINQ